MEELGMEELDVALAGRRAATSVLGWAGLASGLTDGPMDGPMKTPAPCGEVDGRSAGPIDGPMKPPASGSPGVSLGRGRGAVAPFCELAVPLLPVPLLPMPLLPMPLLLMPLCLWS